MDEAKAREILELGRNLTEKSLKTAYREQLMVWHPDRFAGQSARMRERAGKRTREITKAHEILIAHLKKRASANQTSKSKRNKRGTKARPQRSEAKSRTKARPQRSEAKSLNAFDKNRRRHGPWESRDSATRRLMWKGTYKNGNRHGVWENYYLGGQLKQRSAYKNGKEHGRWESYSGGGHLKEIATYRAGLLHGWSESFKSDGELKAKGNFKSGERCGEWYDVVHLHLFNWNGLRNYGPCPPSL